MPMAERVVDNINQALHKLFGEDGRLYLLGEDVLDPYGGAFRVTKGLSTAYPERVLTTPVSESAILGVANGLALAGNRVVAEVMFGDFLLLAMDQLINFAAKSTRMFGRRVPLPVVVRCPVGGHRGYGPTHSQSVQKHLIGVPNLGLFEVSPVHDCLAVLRAAIATGQPSVVFEDKVLYTQRIFADGQIDDIYRFRTIPGPGHWVEIHRDAPADVILIVTGGLVHRAVQAARRLWQTSGATATILVTAQLYPMAMEPILPLIETAGRVCVAEESHPGGTWGSEVAARLYPRLWGSLKSPIELVCSADAVIAAAAHLERQVLISADSIFDALAAAVGKAAKSPETVEPKDGHRIVVPTLNTNDVSCVLVEWLVADGAAADAGTAVATVETSKAVTDLELAASGVVRHLRKAGEEIRFGEHIGVVVDAHAGSGKPGGSAGPPQAGEKARAPRNQAAVAETVVLSHRSIPSAFAAAEIAVDAARAHLAELSEASGAELDLAAFLVKAVALLHSDFPACFSWVDQSGKAQPRRADIGVAMDAGAGLFVPVIRRADERDLEQIGDDLMEYRMNALEGRFSEQQLTGAAISLSLNVVDGISLVQPLIQPPQAGMVSFSGYQPRLIRREGALVDQTVITAGFAYDHRVINGREATEFLTRLKHLVEEPGRVSLVSKES